MALMLYDTMAREKRLFEPQDPKRVTMYVCGPTVYNYAHIGNARPAVVFDVLFRLLRHIYGEKEVVYARNITDIDDKIIKAHQETGVPISEITATYAEIYRADMGAVGVLKPTLEPTATGHIAEMQTLISGLMEAGAAYAAEGHVLFDISAYDAYGQLSGVDQDAMLAGARVEVAPYKKNPSDFVLWKPSAEDEPGWEAPAAWGFEGRGRPGWHLECSAMIASNLGTTIDIHGGGHDLRFPHHENEIAQSACVHNGAPLARYWMHNGFLQMGTEKMSKSLGNIKTVHQLLEQWPGEALRWALLSAKYREPLEWTDELVAQSKSSLDRIYRILLRSQDIPADRELGEGDFESFLDTLSDDLNTPAAFSRIFETVTALSSLLDEYEKNKSAPLKQAIAAHKGVLMMAGDVLGLFREAPEAWFKSGLNIDPGEIDRLLAARADARANKDFATADKIRDDLLAQGVVIEDAPEGATWRRA
ncbi:MAG: cysteine--tRNA ligase [Pseudomonadota bacterium]